MTLESWADSHIGLVRKSNQDAVGCFPELGLFLVADGMGGRSEGEVASQLTVDTIREVIGPELVENATVEPGANLAGAVALANRRVYDLGRSRTESPRGSLGTTVVALVCAPTRRRAYWAHVGDSRLYRVRGRGVTLLTADHTMFGEAFWDQESAPFDLPHTNRLVRAVGIDPTVEVSRGQDELRAGDLYLFCSYVFSGWGTPYFLRDRLRAERPVAEIGAGLVELALAAGGRDNASVILVRV
jgi:protein phosphatase